MDHILYQNVFSKPWMEKIKVEKKNNYKALQEIDRNREYDYTPARTQRKLDLQQQKNSVANLPRIQKKRKHDQPGPSTAKH